MSPTKASLARFYPNLLPRAKSAEPPRPVSKENHTSSKPVSAGESETNGAGTEISGTALDGSDSGTNGVEKRQELPVTPKPRLQSSSQHDVSAMQDQSIINFTPRAASPKEGRVKDTVVNGTNGGLKSPVAEAADVGSTGLTSVPDSQNPDIPSTKTRREPHVPVSGMGVGENGEPSLPSTPSQLGLEPPQERPNGLLISSPSRRPRRNRRPSANFSPLRPRDVSPEHPNQKGQSLLIRLGPRRYIANTPKPPPLPEEANLLEIQRRLKDLESQLQDIEDQLLRQVLESSWQQDRNKEEKDMVKRKKDVSLRSTKILQLRDEIVKIQNAQKDDGSARLEAIDHEVASRKEPTLTQRLADYLPFSVKPRLSAPRPASPIPKDIEQALDLDEMPTQAQHFTVTTSETLLLSPAIDNELLQRQEVIMSTLHQLLTCTFQLTTNVTTQRISHLDVRALSSWAEPELGSWLRRPRENMGLAVLGRAFGRYWEVAKLRGKCWTSCMQDFKDLIANVPESTGPSFHLGMQALVFARSNVQLKVDWRISLGDEGEVESHSSAHPRFPPAWTQEADNELTKVGEAFALLVEDRGISEAIGTICKVVFPK